MKRKMLLIPILLTIIIFCFPTHSIGEDSNYSAITVGIYSPTGDLDKLGFDDGLNIEFILGEYISENIAFETAVGSLYTDRSLSEFISGIGVISLKDEINIISWTGTLKAIFSIKEADEVYIGGGIGVYWTTWDATLEIPGLGTDDFSEDDYVFGMHILIGMTLNIAENIFIGVEGRHMWTGNVEVDTELFGIPMRGNNDLNGFIFSGVISYRW